MRSASEHLLAFVLLFCGTGIATSPADEVELDLTHPSFAELEISEIALLGEFQSEIAEVELTYQSLTMEVVQWSYLEPFADHSQKSTRNNLELLGTSHITVRRLGEKRYRVDAGTIGESPLRKYILLINDGTTWRLNLGRDTGKYYISREGRELQGSKGIRYTEWWIDAPYCLRYERLSENLLSNSPRSLSRIKSVRETAGESGERLVEVRRDRLPAAIQPGDEQHDIPSEVLVFYRDHHWVLKRAVQLTHFLGQPIQMRATQTCEYLEFGEGIPLLAKVVYEEESRALEDRDDDSAWASYSREEVEFRQVTLETPEASLFELDGLVAPRNVEIPSRQIAPMKWILAANGIFFFVVGYLIYRRTRTPATPDP